MEGQERAVSKVCESLEGQMAEGQRFAPAAAVLETTEKMIQPETDELKCCWKKEPVLLNNAYRFNSA